MKTLVKRLLTLAVILGLIGGGYVVFARNAASKKPTITYETGQAATGNIRSFVTATGIIQPWKVVDVKANVAGRIDKLYVDLGATVKAGQAIADIDPTDTRTALEQANADLQSARAREQQAQASVEQQKMQAASRVASAERAVAGAKARLAQAKANMEIQPEMTNQGISQAKAAKQSAEKAVLQARQSKKQLEQQLANLKEVTIPLNVATVNSTLNQAKANLNTAAAEHRRQRNLMGQGYVAQSDVQQAEATLATMQAGLRQARQRQETMSRENELSIRELEARLESAQSTIEEASARVDQAEASLRLAMTGTVTNDVRRHEHRAAQAAVEQTEAELRGARAEFKLVTVREKEVVAASAQIVRGQASQRQAVTNLGFTRVTAPRSGVIIAKNVEEGTVVPSSRASIGSTNALLQIGDVSKLWVVCNVDETDIGQVTQGQKVTIKVDAYPSLIPEGKVIRVDPQAKVEQNVTLIPVTVEIDMPDPRFKPGMNATCEFVVEEVTDVVTVPNEALKEKNEGEFYVQKLVNGVPQDVPVVPGLAGPDTTEIREGLQAGEEVVTKTVQPEASETTNPFGSPLGGRPGGNRGGGGGGGRR